MKKIILLLAFLNSKLSFCKYIYRKKVDWYTLKVIQYELNSKDYEIKVVKTDDATNLWDLLKENNAITWVNGVFFVQLIILGVIQLKVLLTMKDILNEKNLQHILPLETELFLLGM